MNNKLLAELLGAFTLVFAGTGAIVVNDLGSGVIGHAGVALTFGLVVTALIYAFGEVSGAHFNPAVTLGFAMAGRFAWKQAPGYMLAQMAGALLASASLHLLFPTHATLGSTRPAGSVMQSFMLELILTAILMLVILRVSSGAKEKGITAGVAVGCVIALEAMCAGPVCGASMNPARSLAPALVSGHLDHVWIYVLAPLLGALAVVPLSFAFDSFPPPAPADS